MYRCKLWIENVRVVRWEMHTNGVYRCIHEYMDVLIYIKIHRDIYGIVTLQAVVVG